ncbi:VOC family protein [Pseudonocardia spirodelae]|uniref:VOC family protein n=1 Tax=Pseudonocardia spirodelae TaxID=3133431 RepID=A0ABU8T6S3_9PSEU
MRAPTGLWASLSCRDPRATITFLTAAFGLTERAVHTEAGEVVHAELLHDEGGGLMLGPARPGGCPPGGASVHLVCEDPDAVFARAVAAGAAVVAPFDADYGSRLFVVTDPEGNHWSAGTWYE